jgi:ATP-dependent 26S proteasome regulatory subunit
MIVSIIFYKSSSKYYDSLCTQCEWFDKYERDKSTNKLSLKIEEMDANLQKVEAILNIVRNWTKTEYLIDDVFVDISAINRIISILHCCKNCDQCTIKSEYCYGDTGWGCSQIESISLRKDNYYSYRTYSTSLYWYDFGHFDDEKWILDKGLIFDHIRSEIEKKHIDICKHFSINRIKEVIDNLPLCLEVVESGEWQYKYRPAPIGMQQTEIIGVIPAVEKSRFSSGFSIRLPDLFQEDDEAEQEEGKERSIPEVTFSDIGGIDEVINQVREVIELPIVAPELFNHYHIRPHRGILLYGPPGCGKTIIAKAVANEINAHFITVNGPEILNKFIGQSEANLRAIFKEAQEMIPSIIYFDEFDAISATRDTESNPLNTTVVNQLLTLMDGLNTSSKVCVIASTNRIDIIDEAIKRPGRFDYKIEVQKPTLEGCKSIFGIHTKNMPIDSHFDQELFVEKYLHGYTGAEIAFVATEAAYNSIRRTVNLDMIFDKKAILQITNKNIITELDFINAVKKLKESNSRSQSAKYRY